MAASDDSSHYFTEFTLAEIVDMENLYKELGDQSLHKDLCQTVASTFSDVNRNGKSSVTWKQSWFQEKLKQQISKQQYQPKYKKTVPSPPTEILDLSNLCYTRNAANAGNAENVTYVQRRKGKPSDVNDLAFEAKSARDDAWYDVASFLTYRVIRTGELEVRVRFSGFDNQHDEWVNVKTSVRERSIPVEPSECGRVNVGDLLLCFQEREDQALHCDAHVVNIKRGIHDHGRCNCVFLVRYDLDNTEEPVGHERICRRPEE
ncbi:SAWADEE HOMEODOMAIN-like protein 1 [Cardamine amara subsp. amara]|uniref:SAWADEE HOMEODOMAIN-like protein 1 n=1 Tax=Cardamine amara subsp. amara TaxID=228776 RepID=A0ABD1APU2_CARAN